MSTRAVDMQMLMWRLHDVQELQSPPQQQPQVAQTEFARYFANQTEHKKEQVQAEDHTEGAIIREEQERRSGGQQRRRRRQPEKQDSEKSEKPPVSFGDSGSRIDVRV